MASWRFLAAASSGQQNPGLAGTVSSSSLMPAHFSTMANGGDQRSHASSDVYKHGSHFSCPELANASHAIGAPAPAPAASPPASQASISNPPSHSTSSPSSFCPCTAQQYLSHCVSLMSPFAFLPPPPPPPLSIPQPAHLTNHQDFLLAESSKMSKTIK